MLLKATQPFLCNCLEDFHACSLLYLACSSSYVMYNIGILVRAQVGRNSGLDVYILYEHKVLINLPNVV